MSDYWAYLPADGWSRFAVDAVWQGTLVGLLAWRVLRPLVRQPAARAWLLLLALICLVAVPLASAAVRANGGGLLDVAPGVHVEQTKDIASLPTT